MIPIILDFWFNELTPAQWWHKDPELDRLIIQRFSSIHQQASQCELAPWRETPQGRLAEIIILDQFSRNIYRDTPQAFSTDQLALALAQHAVSIGDDMRLTAQQRSFLYMPYMHSESVNIHQISIGLFRNSNLQHNLSSALEHQAIIDKFGRYPHRNSILGRNSTPQELEFLKQPGSSF